MTINEKIRKCNSFFYRLAEVLKDNYTVFYPFAKNGKKGSDKYLLIKGTEDYVTYYEKPAMSFRCSTHWNWYEKMEKCNKEHYIQCLNVDLPFAKKRPQPGEASHKIAAEQVAFVGNDGKYHAVYGEIFDRKTRTWHWMETDPKDVALELGLITLW